MSILCKIFHHKFKYFIIPDTPIRNIRVCTNCTYTQEYRRNTPSYGTGWFRLISRTNRGAKELLGELYRLEKKNNV